MTVHRVPFRLTGWNSLVNRNVLRLISPSRNFALASFQPAIENIETRELFEYTSGRWIYNESHRLAERRLAISIDELKKAAADSVNRPASDVKSLRKLAEGGFNRVFEITMIDGSSILARLPYSSTLPRRLAVASEVATLAFVRAHGILTPQILSRITV